MSTYAIIDVGGEQLRLETGRFYDIRHLPPVEWSTWSSTKILFSCVLMIHHQSNTLLGTPWVENAVIKGRILHIRRNEKLTIYKMQPKKKTRRKRGHRQNLARFVVDAIFLNGKNLTDK
uniref:Large ribosomal subunit protein bL21c n=1 Tax=Netrium digitus TaxID=43946 RepID=A0A191T545_9VIRI|nr:ribosomal protein L21 [Netrium digitus]ANI25521.1 ribosomal protein L21 [Netrium digitus]